MLLNYSRFRLRSRGGVDNGIEGGKRILRGGDATRAHRNGEATVLSTAVLIHGRIELQTGIEGEREG